MAYQRLVARIETRDGRVERGGLFPDLADPEDPVEHAVWAAASGADEILVVEATREGLEEGLSTWVGYLAEQLTLPYSVAGPVDDAPLAKALLDAGADRVGLPGAMVLHPERLEKILLSVGGVRCSVQLDVRPSAGAWLAYANDGQLPTPIEAVSWARELAGLGVAEILLTLRDERGHPTDDLDFLSRLALRLSCPLLVNTESPDPEILAGTLARAGGLALTGPLHSGVWDLPSLRGFLHSSGARIRPPTEG